MRERFVRQDRFFRNPEVLECRGRVGRKWAEGVRHRLCTGGSGSVQHQLGLPEACLQESRHWIYKDITSLSLQDCLNKRIEVSHKAMPGNVAASGRALLRMLPYPRIGSVCSPLDSSSRSPAPACLCKSNAAENSGVPGRLCPLCSAHHSWPGIKMQM